MDHLRSLYKANPISPKKCKRKEAHEIRANKRSELYTSTRNISPSPSSKRTQCSPREYQKENFNPLKPSEAEKLLGPDKSRSPSTKINEKLNRQKAHILKFLAWKAEKAKQAEIKEKSKRAPFVVSTRNCAATVSELTNNNKKPSFAPANHIFRPPAALQSFELKVINSNSVRLINGTREETYHFLATPNKKTKKLESDVSTLKTYKKPIPVLRAVKVKPIADNTPVANARVTKTPLNPKPMLASTDNVHELPKRKANPVQLKPKPVLPPIKRSVFKAPKKCNSSISNAFMAVTGNTNFRGEIPIGKLKGKSVIKALAEVDKQPEHIPKTSTDTNLQDVVTLTKNKLSSKEPSSEALILEKDNLVHPVVELTSNSSDGDTKPMPVPKTATVKPISGKTRVATTRLTKTPLNSKPKLDTKINVQEVPSKTKANSVLSKPKPVLPPIKRSTFKAPKKCSSSISNAFMSVNGNTQFRGGPPKVKLNGKSAPKTMAEAGKCSKQIHETPTDANQGYPFLNIVTSTKRKSISSKESSANSLFVEMDQLVSPVDDTTTHLADGEKFNFLRYSVVQSDASKLEDEVEPKVNNDVTPEKAAGSQTPTTYLSPYVSVSRGKVGIKIEREKRNSVYMSVDKSVKEDADTTAKARHTMATVHYYRKQLKDEISRLDDQCDTWQQYKEANAHLLEDTGSDMINVTIGQTKLLTTKKLKQFGDLIDRCEDGAMGKKSLGKGDGAKPILTEDLEGFWSMVGLQIENVEKRFANLQRWKDNNWKDPDEVPAKSNQNINLKKIKKLKPGSTAGPNRDLQKILKSAQAAFLRKKTANSGLDEDVILTPSKSRQILIRDRRSRSSAATVITVNTPKVSRKSSVFDQTTPTGIIADTNVLPHINGFRKSMNLFKSTLLNKQEKRSPGSINCASPLPLCQKRKSILKTPGSKYRPKSVIFNSPTLQFTVEDKVEDESPPQDISPSKLETKEEEERTYSLRTRSIKLRDLADILIPE